MGKLWEAVCYTLFFALAQVSSYPVFGTTESENSPPPSECPEALLNMQREHDTWNSVLEFNTHWASNVIRAEEPVKVFGTKKKSVRLEKVPNGTEVYKLRRAGKLYYFKPAYTFSPNARHTMAASILDLWTGFGFVPNTQIAIINEIVGVLMEAAPGEKASPQYILDIISKENFEDASAFLFGTGTLDIHFRNFHVGERKPFFFDFDTGSFPWRNLVKPEEVPEPHLPFNGSMPKKISKRSYKAWNSIFESKIWEGLSLHLHPAEIDGLLLRRQWMLNEKN